MQESIDSFDDFWPHYVHAHRNPMNRVCHYVGTSVALGAVGAAAITLNPAWLLVAPVVGYGSAWVGHFVFERNKPATFEHPLWSFRGDFKMLSLALRGKMGDEVERVCGGELAPDHTHADHVAQASHSSDAGARNGSATATA